MATALGSPEQTDLPLQFHVWWEEVRRLVGAGEPPWISDRIGGGAGLYAHGQTGVPFPLQLPVWVLGAERGTAVLAVWKLILAGLGLALCMTRLGLRQAAAVAAGAGWAFNLYLLSWLVVPLTWVVAAAGWVLWALLGALRGHRGQAAFLALLLGVLCGWSIHPESAVFLLTAAVCVGLVLAWGRRRRLARLTAPLALAMMVAGIGALPTVLTLAGSAKWAAAISAAKYPETGVSLPLRLQAAGQLLSPWRDGHPADGSFRLPFPAAAVAASAGTLPLIFLLAGGVRRRHWRLAGALAGVSALTAALLYQIPGAAHLLAHLPILGQMTWARAAFLLPLCVTVLGALGLDAWLRRPRPVRLAIGAGAVQAAVLLAALLPLREPLHPAATRTLLAPAGVACLSPLLATAGGAFVPVLVAAEVVAQGWEVVPGVSRRDGEGEALAVVRELSKHSQGRVLGVGTALPPNTAARWGLADLRAHDPVRSTALARLHAALGAAGMDLPGDVTLPWAGLAGAWGVEWLVTPPSGMPAGQAAGWLEVWCGAGGCVYGNSRALPVVRLASAAVPAFGDPAAGDWETVGFATTAVVEGDPLTLGGQGTLEVEEQRSHRWRVRVRAGGEVLALLHVPRAPGWQAFLDGHEVTMVRANLAAMGVVVPPGEHHVEWRYSPPGLATGALLTGLGVGGCVWLARSRRRR